MGYFLYIASIAWSVMGNTEGAKTILGSIYYMIAAIFFVGGAIVFSLKNQATKEQPHD